MGVLILSAAAEGNGYTPTHYVAPYASAAGSPSGDDDVQNGTAYSNASNPATPCTIWCALTNATAGNIVQVGAGTYTVPRVDTSNSNLRFNPAYYPVNQGTSGNPIVFAAQYPAAYTSDTTLRSKLRANSVVGSPEDSNACITVGFRGQSSGSPPVSGYAVWDGMWVDSADGAYPYTYGQAAFGPKTLACEFRRMVFTRGNDIAGGNNRAAIFSQASRNCKVRDCHFDGGNDVSGTPNNIAGVNTYSTENITIENNLFEDMACGIYLKAEFGDVYDTGGPLANNATVRFNKFSNIGGNPIVAAECENTASTTLVYQNLVNSAKSGVAIIFATNQDDKNVHIYNNTIYGITGSSSDQGAGFVFVGSVTDTDLTVFRDNIVSTPSNSSAGCIVTQGSSNTACIDICNYNMFYAGANTERFVYENSSAMTLATWKTQAAAFDANSTLDDPEFVNAAGGNFKLGVGSPARTASSTGGVIGCYITGNEEMGLRANPTY